VTTKALNQAVKRNGERFPEDFAFQLTIAEVACTKAVDSIGKNLTGHKL
jgi:ORF6N domain-containing protein